MPDGDCPISFNLSAGIVGMHGHSQLSVWALGTPTPVLGLAPEAL